MWVTSAEIEGVYQAIVEYASKLARLEREVMSRSKSQTMDEGLEGIVLVRISLLRVAGSLKALADLVEKGEMLRASMEACSISRNVMEIVSSLSSGPVAGPARSLLLQAYRVSSVLCNPSRQGRYSA